MLILSLVVATLAVARLSTLLVDDKITAGYRRWVVRTWGESSTQTYLAHCNWCTSIWVAAIIMPIAAIFPNTWVVTLFAIPAASLVASLLAGVRLLIADLDTWLRR